MPKYDRLLYILNLLRSRRNLNADALAKECGVTERTIYRDIASLSEANIPIYYDHGYKYASNNFLPPLNFNIDEYLTLINALETSPLAKSGNGRKLVKTIKSKIEAVLTPDVKNKKLYHRPTTEVRIKSTISGNFSGEIMSGLEKAIQNFKPVEIEYDSIDGGPSVREVEPYFIIFLEHAFYLVAYCLMRNDFRTFRIDRIRRMSILDRTFKIRKNLDPAGYFKDSWGVFQGEPIEVEVLFSGKAARVIKMSRHHPNERIEEIDCGRIKYMVTVSGDLEIIRWILSYGDEAVVVKPEVLKNKIARIIKNAVSNYS